MNKTVTINISGIIFHIEEDAYEKLSKYLSTIKGYFSRADGGNEIMSDIEARIAEMLQAKTNAVKQVVLMADVDQVMESMGKPEEFADGNEANTSENSNAQFNESYNISNEPVKKRVYRDPDDKVLGGVCGGIAHYFGFDPVWLRIAMACLFFFAGTGFLLYLILWIAIPEATTIAEKLAMKGEKADINNISKAVKEEAEQLKKRMEKYGDEFKNMGSNNRDIPRNAVEKIVDFLTQVITRIGKVLLKIIGVCLVIFGVIFFLGLFGSVFGMSFLTSNVEVKDWIDMILLDGKDFYLGLLGIICFAGIPIIMMIYGGIKLLFKVHYTNRWVNLTAGILWLVGFILLLYVGLRTAKDFNREVKVRESITVIQNDTLILKMTDLPLIAEEISSDLFDNEDGIHIKNRRNRNEYMIGKHDNIRYLLGAAQLNIIKSQTDKIELVIVKEAKGGEKRIATEFAKNITYNVSQTDSLLTFDNLFKVNNADKFRCQDLKVILKLPLNKVVYLDKSLEDFIYDIENVSNTYDSDMVNRRWIMTNQGLKCLDCDGLTSMNDNADDEDLDDDKENVVKINSNGLNVNAKDARIKMDSTGIKIHSEDANITIDNNGVHVKSKK